MKLPFPQKVLEQHVAVLGKTGSGKTCTAKLIVEQVVAGNARVCVLDPIKSDWWGMTSSSDGKDAGLPFHILGGPRGHVPLHAQAGGVIGEIVANGSLPLSILDMADFEMGGLQTFFTHFAPTLLRKMRGVLYLVVEEAHEFAPKERGGFGAENMAIHFAKKLATAGRSKGIRLIVATQRTQSLHNAVLGSCDTMIAHRMTAPADQEPVVKWLKANLPPDKAKEVASSLQSLKTGEAWVCSGEIGFFERVQFPRISTYDNSATPTNDLGRVAVKTASVDHDKLRAIIGTAVEEAKANDPAELKRKIVALEKQLSTRPIVAPVETPRVFEKPIITDGDRDLIAKTISIFSGYPPSFERTLVNANAVLDELKLLGRRIQDFGAVRPSPPAIVRTPIVRKMVAPESVPNNGTLAGTQRKILDVIATLNARGIDANRESVARWLDIHPNGGRYCSDLAALRSGGYIDGTNLTLAGQKAAQPMATGFEAAKSPLSGTQRTILDILSEDAENRFTRETLAERLGIHPNGGRYCSDLARLRTMGLIPERGEIYLTQGALL